MAKLTESAVHVIGGTGEAHVITAAEDDLKLADDAARTLPPQAVKDLLSIGVCIRCIFRLLGGSKYISSCISLPTAILFATLRKLKGLEDVLGDNDLKTNEDVSSQSLTEEPGLDPKVCGICLGILQFSYCDDKGMLVKKDGAREFAALIAEMVKQEGHQIDNFSLEVSIPARVMENEQAAWLYMKNKYVSESWFQEKLPPGHISGKEAFKMAISHPLESSMHADCVQSSSFRIRLTYTHFEETGEVHELTGTKESNKRRKIGTDVMNMNGAHVASGTEQFECISGKEGTRRSSNGPNDSVANHTQFQLEKVSQPCRLILLCNSSPLYIGGRYLKYSRNVSQSRWIVDDERVGEASVEEIIGSSILPLCKGDNYKFHAAGREDIDVRMLGSGRPFLVEIQNARHVPSEIAIKEIEGKLNSSDNKLVGVKNLKVVGSQGWSLMREGEVEKQKQYVALVWISRSLEDNDMKALSSSKDMPISQKTPVRVLHRRSPLEREKIIHWMRIERVAGSSQYFLLHLCTQAGTYIKEFVHGDLGRTHPSVGSILGCRAEILQLDVTDVKMDCFLTD